jgi:translation initiation factor RLI1
MTRLAIIDKHKCKPDKCGWLCMNSADKQDWEGVLTQGEDGKAR